jgi:hypothetical protein
MARKDGHLTIIPNLVDDIHLHLSAAAIRLYLHIKRRAGENKDGSCYESQDNIARYCKMHKQTIVRAKKELETAGLIQIESKQLDKMKHPGHVITIIDIWDRNTEFYDKGSLKGIPQSKTDTALNSPKGIPQSGENGYRKRGENVPSKKNPLKKNPEGFPAGIPAGSKLSKNPHIAQMQKELGFPDKRKTDPIPNPGKEAAFIKKMQDRGFTWTQIFGTWLEKVMNLHGEFVSMYYVNNHIGGHDAKARFPGAHREYTEPPEDD